MQQSSMDQIDRATLTLLRVLTEHGDEMAPYFDPDHLEALKTDLSTLRKALLGLQMGPLYWETPADEEDENDDATFQAEQRPHQEKE